MAPSDPVPPMSTWATAITRVETDNILVRGYALDEIMGRLTFGEAIYLLLAGERPSRAFGRLMEALLVSSIDHGVQPPSTLAARTVAGTGAPPRAAAAAGVLALGSPLGGGGNIENSRRFLDQGIALVGDWVSPDDAARRLLDDWRETSTEGRSPRVRPPPPLARPARGPAPATGVRAGRRRLLHPACARPRAGAERAPHGGRQPPLGAERRRGDRRGLRRHRPGCRNGHDAFHDRARARSGRPCARGAAAGAGDAADRPGPARV